MLSNVVYPSFPRAARAQNFVHLHFVAVGADLDRIVEALEPIENHGDSVSVAVGSFDREAPEWAFDRVRLARYRETDLALVSVWAPMREARGILDVIRELDVDY